MPARFARCLAAAVAATTALDAAALAEPPHLIEGQVVLQYRRGPNAVAGCPDERTFRERAADEFGSHDPFTPAGADAATHMRVEITRTNDHFLATIFAVNTPGYAVSMEQDANCDALVWRLAHLMGQAILRAPSSPAARPKGPRLRYMRGPAGCLSEADFRREVTIEARDGVDRFDADGGETISVAFDRLLNGQYRATIEHPGPKDGSEVQTHANCQILGRWVAVSVYRLVRVPDEPTPPTPAPPEAAGPVYRLDRALDLPTTTPPAAPTAAELETPQPPAQHRVRSLLCLILSDEFCMDLKLTALAMGIMTAGWTPDVGGGLALGGEIQGSVLSFQLAVRGVFPSRVVATEPVHPELPSYAVTFDFSQVGVDLVPCARWKFLMGCAVGQFGLEIAATNRGPAVSGRVALGPRVGVDVPINERISVFGFGEALFLAFGGDVAFDRPPANDPTLPTANVHWLEPIVSASFGAGLALHFQ